ncbi:MAG: glutamate decarboxylase [Actinomycetota bacterium]|nr:glutamate decarboxylase [Actinomycetota bacterium]
MPHVKYRSPSIAPAYTGRLSTEPIPSLRLPIEPMEPAAAYRFIHDELMLDGSSRLNLATFVTTWMDPEAEKLMAETFDKNMIDKDEYPATAAIESRCVSMVADLFHAENLRDDDAASAVGVSTVGSSEAVMLGGLALKWRWKQRVAARAGKDGAGKDGAGKDEDAWKTRTPNLVMGANVQVVWEKFCRYFEVEPRYLPMAEDRYVITPEQVVAAVDEDTIGVVGILGTTYTGELEPIAEICAALDALEKQTGLDIPVHVDAASGGFVVPFLQPDLKWDFRLPRVASINVSGHKYGLTYPGIGFVVWRNAEQLPEELVFRVNYLGGDMPTFTLNFSRPGNQVVAQYYNFLRLGRAGYTQVMQTLSETARWFSDQLSRSHHFEVISDGSQIPVVAFRLAGGAADSAGGAADSAGGPDGGPGFNEFDVSTSLRSYGWQVPAYTMPDGAEDVTVLRVVVREGFSADLARSLWADLQAVIAHLGEIKPGGYFTQEHFAH